MSRIIVLTVALLLNFVLFNQATAQTQPFIIRGQLKNCPEKHLTIAYSHSDGQLVLDTIVLDDSGKFYLETYKVHEPVLARIQQNNIQINYLFAAPGYNLTITGDGSDFNTLLKSKKVSGIGSESNAYAFILDSIRAARKDDTKWFELDKNALLVYINKEQKLKDSIANIVFNKKPVNDKFLSYFGNMVRYDNMFINLYMLLANVNWSKYDFDESVSYIRSSFDNKILADIYNEKYLISDSYKSWVILNEWPSYLINLDKRKDTALANQDADKMKKIFEAYPDGAVKEFAMVSLMEGAINYTKSLEQLNNYKKRFDEYATVIKKPSYKTRLASAISEKETELLRTQVGQPAPAFSLSSNTGSMYNLSDFKNKVVYLDLWASWCKPCRAETPAFKKLYDKYKNDPAIAFISIAVQDGVNEWKKALQEDKPGWLQLIDEDDTVWSAYVANTIPKFIVIDKQGNISNFDAPRPSSGEEIEQVLNKEIGK